MDDDFVSFGIGFLVAALLGLFFWGSLGANVASGSMVRDYSEQHCRPLCAPNNHTAKHTNNKFSCTCLVPVKP